MKTCLFITNIEKSSFIKIDYELLSAKSNVLEFVFYSKSAVQILSSQLKQLILIFKQRMKIDFIYARFADYHSLIPALAARVLNIPFYLILGGSDTHFLAKYQYGNIYGPFGYRKFCVKKSLKFSTHLFPVSQSIIEYTNTFIPGETYYYGAKALVKKFNTDYTIMPNSIEESKWNVGKKKKSFLTVAMINNMRVFTLKGIDLYFDLAEKMSDHSFILIGLSEQLQSELNIPKNVKVFNHLSSEQLRKYYAETKVFCLFSYTEGTPNVLLEAMASGCIPVVSDVSTNKNIVADHGFLLSEKNVDLAHNICLEAIEMSDYDPNTISEDIKQRYSIKKRERFISQIVSGKYLNGELNGN